MAFTGTEGTRPYQGTAWYYAEYRPRLTDAFVRLLVHHLGLTRDDRVLDLGAGPGQIALVLAPHVGEVVAVDAEPDMVDEGRRRARERGIDNVVFQEARAENLAALGEPEGAFRTVTIGSAFHWMLDQDDVLRQLDRLTARSGTEIPPDPAGSRCQNGDREGSVVITAFDVGRPGVAISDRDERPWLERPPWSAADAVVRRYAAEAAEGPHPRGRHDPFPDIFARSAFSQLELLRLEYDDVVTPSVDALLGIHYSNSHTLARLGDRRAEMEAEVYALLADADASPVTVRKTDSALIARRPA